MGYQVHMMACEATLLREIANPKMKRLDIAKTYWWAIIAHHDGVEEIDWLKVNTAIIERWSRSALEWIKKQAWSGKCYEEAT